MSFPVIKGAAYALIQASNMLLHQGTTQTSERRKNPTSEHLEKLSQHLRSFQEAVSYPPNQVYIGNMTPDDLKDIPRPWYQAPVSGASRVGKHGEIMPEDEFLGLMKIVDAFDLVVLEEEFQTGVKGKISAHPVLKNIKDLDKLSQNPGRLEEISRLVEERLAQPIYFNGKLVGCVKKAHEFDEALSDHVMFENLVGKASAVFALMLLFSRTELQPHEVEYIIECSEEACGDMNQRGGGNFAKAVGELALFRESIHESYAEALEETKVCMITRSDLKEFLIKFPSISLKILSEFSNRLEASEKQTTRFATEKVETRIALFLAECIENENQSMEFVLPMSKKDLASYLGTAPETLSRKLTELEDAGYIKQMSHRRIKVLDLDGLLLR
jgi:DNA-binding transcriptional ArsR family regulator